jgi:hypothetical protein
MEAVDQMASPPTPTAAMVSQLATMNTNITTKRTAYMTAYNTDRTASGLPVGVGLTGTVSTLWNELVALRDQRNTQLATWRSQGYKI